MAAHWLLDSISTILVKPISWAIPFLLNLSGDASDGHKVKGLIYDQSDPGNRATVKFLCESALSLALNAAGLPGGLHCGGILTPATGLGDVLAKRLWQKGMQDYFILDLGNEFR